MTSFIRYCLEEGPSAYSCLGRTADGALACLYERADRLSYMYPQCRALRCDMLMFDW